VELRILAHLSQDEVLVSAFRSGEDIRDRTAREVFSEEELANRAEFRRRAKVINFGIVYGLSAWRGNFPQRRFWTATPVCGDPLVTRISH
jgi:DNA polymerase I